MRHDEARAAALLLYCGLGGWLVALAIVTLAGDPTCPSDLNSDGNVATADLLQLLSDWGPCPSEPFVVDVTTRQQPG